jgi:hypothetical protein
VLKGLGWRGSGDVGDCGDDFLRSIGEAIRTEDGEVTASEGGFAGFHVVSLKTNHQRQRQSDFIDSGDDALAMTLQSMMPPKMLTRMPFTFGSPRMILKADAT